MGGAGGARGGGGGGGGAAGGDEQDVEVPGRHQAEGEEDAARAFDRVSIAKLGHAEAKTNFPVAEYRAQWAELEALGVDGAVAIERERVAAERPDVMNKASRFRGVTKLKGGKGRGQTQQPL